MDKYAVHTPPVSTEKTASGTKPPKPPAEPLSHSTDPVRCPVCLAPCAWLGCWHCPTHGTAPFE